MLKKHELKIAIIILSILLILSMRVITTGASPAVSTAPSLWVNDEPFVGAAQLPLIIRDGVPYIPVIIFKQMPSVKIGPEEDSNIFFIQHGSAGISFNYESGKAFNRLNDEIPNCKAIKAGRHGNDMYVPAYSVANTINLEIDWDTSKHQSLRIKDATATRDFKKMLEKYEVIEPVAATTRAPVTTAPPPPVTTTEPPVLTEPPSVTPNTDIYIPAEITTEPPPETTPENTQDINNYLMFSTGNPQVNSDRLENVMNFLSKNKIRAVFFLSGEEIADNPETLRRLFAAGHDIGIKIDRSDFESTQALAADIETVNAYIYSLIKQKTRFFNISAAFDDAEFMKDCLAELKRTGYFQCKNNINPEPGDFADIYSAVDFLKQKQVNLFAFDLDNPDNNYNYLELLAQSSRYKFYINFSHINNANAINLK